MKPVARLLLTATLAAALVACGGGDTTAEQTTEVAQEANDVEQFCSFSAELDAQDGPPSEEQLAEVVALAPPEISEDVTTLAAAVREQNFDDPEVAAAEDRIVAWEDENCPERASDGAAGAEATPS